jgi:hypothetical protein
VSVGIAPTIVRHPREQEWPTYEGRTVFAQLMDHLPRHTFRRLVKRYGGDRRVKNFTCWDQVLCMACAQPTYRDSPRDIEACLGAMEARRLYSRRVDRTTGLICNRTILPSGIKSAHDYPFANEIPARSRSCGDRAGISVVQG